MALTLDDILHGPPDDEPILADPQPQEIPAPASVPPGLTPERLLAIVKGMRWLPQEGPQLEVWNSKADQTLMGGQAGGGKSALVAGLATVGPHKQILIVRRQGTELQPIIDEIRGILGTEDGLNRSTGVWRLPDRLIRLGGVPNPGDEFKFQGAARDLLLVDECTALLESQVRFLLGWQRSTTPGQRVRAVFTCNPPSSSDGFWVLRWFAPWVDSSFPNPAKPGELRWVAMVDGAEQWRDGPEPFTHKGEIIRPISRTFIPAKLSDNRFLRDTGYLTQLQALPEPLRSQLLHGDWNAGRSDDEWALIPSLWIKQAMDRWTPPDLSAPVTSVGVDPSRGGDAATISIRRGWRFDELLTVKPDATGLITGAMVAKRVLDVAGESAPIHLDVIGVGSSAYDHLEAFIGSRVIPVNVSLPSEEQDQTGNLKFANIRAALHWRLRELLDPTRPLKIALPRDQKLYEDLCAPRYRPTARGIQVEAKEEIRKRLGRSPDRGDAVVLACMRTPMMIDHRTGQRFTVRRAFQFRREDR